MIMVFFSPNLWLIFDYLNCVFWRTDVLNLDEIQFTSFSFMTDALYILGNLPYTKDMEMFSIIFLYQFYSFIFYA